MAVLKPKHVETSKTISVRISTELHAQVEAIRTDAEAAGLVFDLADVVGKALVVAVKSARSELYTLGVQRDRTDAPGFAEGLAQSAAGAMRHEAGGASARRDESL